MFKTSAHEDAHCIRCNKNTNHDESITYELNENLKFVIIRVNLTSITTIYTRYKMQIANFNPDKIIIPVIKDTFFLKSVIVHVELQNSENFDLRIHEPYGHYTALLSDKNIKPGLKFQIWHVNQLNSTNI